MEWQYDQARNLCEVRKSEICPQPKGILSFLFAEKGLFAKDEIKEGTKIGTYYGRLLTGNALNKQKRNPYLLSFLSNDGQIVGIISDSVLRFSNHSSTPNMITRQNVFYALCDIPKNKELTWDYNGPA